MRLEDSFEFCLKESKEITWELVQSKVKGKDSFSKLRNNFVKRSQLRVKKLWLKKIIDGRMSLFSEGEKDLVHICKDWLLIIALDDWIMMTQKKRCLPIAGMWVDVRVEYAGIAFFFLICFLYLLSFFFGKIGSKFNSWI